MATDYARLESDLRAACAAATKVAPIKGDHGYCNRDTLWIRLPRANRERVMGLAERAGFTASRISPGLFFIFAPRFAQADDRALQCKAMESVLAARGWEVGIHEQGD